MTIKELNRLLTANNIPEDALLMSDSGWECGASDMDGIYYNSKDNVVVFTQDFSESKYNKYEHSDKWVRVEVERKE